MSDTSAPARLLPGCQHRLVRDDDETFGGVGMSSKMWTLWTCEWQVKIPQVSPVWRVSPSRRQSGEIRHFTLVCESWKKRKKNEMEVHSIQEVLVCQPCYSAADTFSADSPLAPSQTLCHIFQVQKRLQKDIILMQLHKGTKGNSFCLETWTLSWNPHFSQRNLKSNSGRKPSFETLKFLE